MFLLLVEISLSIFLNLTCVSKIDLVKSMCRTAGSGFTVSASVFFRFT